MLRNLILRVSRISLDRDCTIIVLTWHIGCNDTTLQYGIISQYAYERNPTIISKKDEISRTKTERTLFLWTATNQSNKEILMWQTVVHPRHAIFLQQTQLLSSPCTLYNFAKKHCEFHPGAYSKICWLKRSCNLGSTYMKIEIKADFRQMGRGHGQFYSESQLITSFVASASFKVANSHNSNAERLVSRNSAEIEPWGEHVFGGKRADLHNFFFSNWALSFTKSLYRFSMKRSSVPNLIWTW